MNTEKCGNCVHFWPLQKALPKGGTKKLTRGHCLKRSVFPKNKPGKPVYPPGAIIKDLPFNRGQPHIVHKDDTVPTCTSAEVKP